MYLLSTNYNGTSQRHCTLRYTLVSNLILSAQLDFSVLTPTLVFDNWVWPWAVYIDHRGNGRLVVRGCNVAMTTNNHIQLLNNLPLLSTRLLRPMSARVFFFPGRTWAINIKWACLTVKYPRACVLFLISFTFGHMSTTTEAWWRIVQLGALALI